MKEYSRHTSLERERVKESLVPGKKEYTHSRKVSESITGEDNYL